MVFRNQNEIQLVVSGERAELKVRLELQVRLGSLGISLSSRAETKRHNEGVGALSSASPVLSSPPQSRLSFVRVTICEATT